MKKSVTKYILIGALLIAIAGGAVYAKGGNLQGKFSATPITSINPLASTCKGTLEYTTSGGSVGDLSFDDLSSLVEKDYASSSIKCTYKITTSKDGTDSTGVYKASNLSGYINFNNTLGDAVNSFISARIDLSSKETMVSIQYYDTFDGGGETHYTTVFGMTDVKVEVSQ